MSVPLHRSPDTGYDSDEDEIDPATCPYCGDPESHQPGCPMADYPFDLEVELDDECLD